MIKPPKIREHMVRLKTSAYTIRFWFSRNLTLAENGACFSGLKQQIEDFSPHDADLVANFIASKLPDWTPLAAMEVLTNSNHSGTVDYFEWP